MSFVLAAQKSLLPFLKSGTVSATINASTGTDLVSAENIGELATFPARESLKGLAKLNDDWDGFGSVAPKAEAVGNAHQMILDLYRQSTQCKHASWANPAVSASESGEIVFEWWRRDRKLTVYISATEAQFLRISGPDIDDDMQDGELVGSQFLGLWLWLNA
jgi:hypothetical protein